MTLLAALQWLRSGRPLPADGAHAPAIDAAVTPAEMVAAANAAGYDCSEAEIQAAFRQDWAMRWLRYTQRGRPDEAT